jgi:flagellar protein FlaG
VQAPVVPAVAPAPAKTSPGVEQVVDQASQKAAPKLKSDAASDAAQVATAASADQVKSKVQEFARQGKEVMAAAAAQIQGYLQDSGRNLNVSLDESTGYYVARVVNPETGEVVRSLPSDETLRIARNIDMMRGLLVNQKA